MIDPHDINDAFEALSLGGIRPPALYANMEKLAAATQVYAGLLTEAGVTVEALQRAVASYLVLPSGDGYPKPWPDPGTLIAHTPVHAEARRVARAAEDAWKGIEGMHARGYNRYELPPLTAYSEDLAEAERIVGALNDAGGWLEFCATDTHDLREFRRQFLDAYARRSTALTVRA